ncbi:hypothetical protein J1N35_005184 [Gossypium stocksii]|uniref:RNase H type-1 domain-containing protein n=1 Tax=Gossypium stocksii TaxID=47602 RepID=A0A9D3WCD8_9ROSI|nr:hypothetical protein J1N35_005184 [Gossypium stocksii]
MILRNEVFCPICAMKDESIVHIFRDCMFVKHVLQEKRIAGIVLRNNLGQIVGACAYPFNSVQDPVLVEAYACLRAVIYVEELGFDNICVEGDALTILKKLEVQRTNRSRLRWRLKQSQQRSRVERLVFLVNSAWSHFVESLSLRDHLRSSGFGDVEKKERGLIEAWCGAATLERILSDASMRFDTVRKKK